MEARTENCCQQIIAEETKRRRHVTSETFDTNWKGCGQDMRSGSRPSESTDPCSWPDPTAACTLYSGPATRIELYRPTGGLRGGRWRAPRGRWYGRGTKTLYLHRRKRCSLDLNEQVDYKRFGQSGRCLYRQFCGLTVAHAAGYEYEYNT